MSRKKPGQGWPVQGAAGEAAVIIVIADKHPALGALARHVGLAGFALGVQAVELLLEAFLGGFPGVDGATVFLDNRLGHRASRI